MPTENGRIYIDNSTTPPKGVSIDDIGTCLGRSSRDLGTLCKDEDGVINKWARYKPIRYDAWPTVTHDQRIGKSFGLVVPFCVNDVMNEKAYNIAYADEPEEGWEYLRPRGDMRGQQGGIWERFRAQDFVRNPSETTPSANGDPTPSTLQGYNHNALIPFEATLDMGGATEDIDYELLIRYYQINLNVTTSIVVTFYNSTGDDLHLQDFINFNDNTGNIKWRPVIQVFWGEYIDARWVEWYEKSQPDYEIAGEAITTTQGGSWTVTLPLSGLYDYTTYPTRMCYLCLGVGCCDQSNPIQWKSNNNALFLLPYNEAQIVDTRPPFVYPFRLVNYSSRHLNVTGLKYFNSSNQWVNAGGTAPSFTIPKASLFGNIIGITMTITKEPLQSVDFVGQYSTTYYETPMWIKIRQQLNYAQEEKYLTPANPNNNWTEVQYINVPTGATSETSTLYARMELSDMSVGDRCACYMMIQTGSSDFTDIGFFSFRMT